MKQVLRAVLALILGYILGKIAAAPLFLMGLWSLRPVVFLASMVLVWFLLPRVIPKLKTEASDSASGPVQASGQHFEPTHRAKNIAINAQTGQIWFRDKKGKQWILNSHDIVGWSHEWTDRPTNLGVGHHDNYLFLKTNNLDHPTHTIWFGGHFKHELAKEWHARLTAMLKY